MYRIIANLQLNRTRVQILLGFLLVMVVVLSVAGALVYRSISDLLIRNAESYVGETAKQASARLDAVLAQVDSLSLQLVTDARIQQLLYKAKTGEVLTIDQKLSVRPILNNLMALSWLIQGIELYAGDEPLYPLENQNISERIGLETATFANIKEGQLIWAEMQRKESGHLFAVRQIRLEDDYLGRGGYVVFRITDSLLDFFNTEFPTVKGSTMHLFDRHSQLVASSSPSLLDSVNLDTLTSTTAQGAHSIIQIQGTDYLKIIRQSTETNWSILMLVPLDTITEGLLVLQQALLWALVVGAVLCLLLLWMMSSIITKPIRRLRNKMRIPVFALPQQNAEVYFNFEMNELNISYNNLVRELHQLVQTVYEKERLNNQAEIKMLQAQIHPHFLFNTLESLYWTLIEKQEEEGAQTVIALSKLFRYTIAGSNDDWVSLNAEIEHCQRYMEIMKYRIGQRLHWQFHIDPLSHDIKLPKLLIQPLVENAIQHGIEPKVGSSSLLVSIRNVEKNGKSLLGIQVKDDGVGMDKETLAALTKRLEVHHQPDTTMSSSSSTGMGLLNVQRRIKLYYGQEYGIHIQSNPERGTILDLYLPYGVERHV
ncbi:two-component system, sensor histidine kinase YesM [Paenibacillus sp. 1_12]|uniref:cache domain-containing sensor histidine kinase n=1 Tax=Paenibacillus sp. 1_12 TaxID=1566278 RepID=UPI0008E834FC|nr:histidine kinase [Paenibacillus sp. 1_12]SFK98297.1 two-component system, sensor histidine kinase YesM [Paenibacillus sp. 1_12]